MSTFRDVESANYKLAATREALRKTKAAFNERPDVPPKIIKHGGDSTPIPSHLREPFGTLLISHHEAEVAEAERRLETVAHELTAAEPTE